jgi:hypothetical protein
MEAYHLQRTRFERLAERNLRKRQLTGDGNVDTRPRPARSQAGTVRNGVLLAIVCTQRRAQEEERGAGIQAPPVVPQSGIYRSRTTGITPTCCMTVIKGRRFPTCPHCKGVTFELVRPSVDE